MSPESMLALPVMPLISVRDLLWVEVEESLRDRVRPFVMSTALVRSSPRCDRI